MPEEIDPTYDGGRANGQNLNSASPQLRPISFAHPEMPDGTVERSRFVGRKYGTNPPRRYRL
jgi:hypothetical protein